MPNLYIHSLGKTRSKQENGVVVSIQSMRKERIYLLGFFQVRFPVIRLLLSVTIVTNATRISGQ